MVWAAKLAVGVVVGLLVYFLFPGRSQARPLTAAAVGFVGAALGALLSERLMRLGGPQLTPTGVATAAGGAFALAIMYVTMSA